MNPTIARHEDEQSEDSTSVVTINMPYYWNRWMNEQAKSEPVFIAQSPFDLHKQLQEIAQRERRIGFIEALNIMTNKSDDWFDGRPLAKLLFLRDIQTILAENRRD